jgi:hypothetical protein
MLISGAAPGPARPLGSFLTLFFLGRFGITGGKDHPHELGFLVYRGDLPAGLSVARSGDDATLYCNVGVFFGCGEVKEIAVLHQPAGYRKYKALACVQENSTPPWKGGLKVHGSPCPAEGGPLCVCHVADYRTLARPGKPG